MAQALIKKRSGAMASHGRPQALDENIVDIPFRVLRTEYGGKAASNQVNIEKSLNIHRARSKLFTACTL
ncbi:MAG: hypothetical protein AAGA21_04055 [Pseudomonadota bacterium]